MPEPGTVENFGKGEQTHHAQPQEINFGEDYKGHKELGISKSYSIVDPWTVMIIPPHTAIAVVSMSYAIAPFYQTVWAHEFSIILLVQA
jgi:hypothetical protein